MMSFPSRIRTACAVALASPVFVTPLAPSAALAETATIPASPSAPNAPGAPSGATPTIPPTTGSYNPYDPYNPYGGTVPYGGMGGMFSYGYGYNIPGIIIAGNEVLKTIKPWIVDIFASGIDDANARKRYHVLPKDVVLPEAKEVPGVGTVTTAAEGLVCRLPEGGSTLGSARTLHPIGNIPSWGLYGASVVTFHLIWDYGCTYNGTGGTYIRNLQVIARADAFAGAHVSLDMSVVPGLYQDRTGKTVYGAAVTFSGLTKSVHSSAEDVAFIVLGDGTSLVRMPNSKAWQPGAEPARKPAPGFWDRILGRGNFDGGQSR